MGTYELTAVWYSAALIGAVLISVATFILVTLNRAIVLRGYLLLAIIAGLFVNVSFLLIAFLDDPALAYVVARLRFGGLALAMLIWLFAIFAYTGRYELITWRWIAALGLFPLLTQIVLWTNDFHQWFLSGWTRQKLGFIWLEQPSYGAWYWLHIAYQNALVLVANGRLLYYFLMRRDTYRGSAPLLVAVTVVTTLLSSSTPIGISVGVLMPNLTPIGFMLVNLFIVFAFWRYRMLDVTPVAYRSVVLNLHDPVIVLDSGGRIAMLNPAAERLIGQSALEVTGKPARETLPKAYCALLDHLEAEEFRCETMIERAGTSHSYDVQLNTLRQGKQHLGSLIVMRDITRRKIAEQEREQLVTDLQAYAHIVAHDLKNPLSVIAGYLELLSNTDPRTNDKWREYLERLIRVRRKMTNIIDDLLLLAQVRQGAQVPLTTVDMQATLQNALQRLEYHFLERGAVIEIISELPEALGYPAWIEQVWVNFISNAVKYGGTPPHVWISARAEGNFIRYEVRDDGNGLTAEQVADLFKPFIRHTSDKIEGHGVGLSIVKSILDKLNGCVGAESEVGKGSTFYFCLPPAHRHVESALPSLEAQQSA